MWSRTSRALAAAFALSLIGAACSGGDSDSASQPQEPASSAVVQDTTADAQPADAQPAETQPATPEPTAAQEATPAPEPEPTTTIEAAPDPAAILADLGVPLKDGTEVIAAAALSDGNVAAGVSVDAPPPPLYGTDLEAAGWNVLDVRFGSEATIAYDDELLLCLIVYANYDSPSDLEYWMWFAGYPDIDPEECMENAEEYFAQMGDFGRPTR